jgi:hypothetical protein
MTDPDDEPTREDALYASLFALLANLFHGNWFWLALLVPLALIPQAVNGSLGAALAAATWLVIGAAYWAIEYRQHGVQTRWAIILMVIGLGTLGGLALLTLSETRF